MNGWIDVSFSYGVSGIGPISQLESISLPSEGWDVELMIICLAFVTGINLCNQKNDESTI